MLHRVRTTDVRAGARLESAERLPVAFTAWVPSYEREVRAAVPDLVVTVGERIRRRDQVARKLTLTVRLAGGASVARPWALPAASGHTEDLRLAAYRILDGMALQRARMRRLVLPAEALTAAEAGPGAQMSLDPEREARLRIEPVLDRLNTRWGRPVAAYRHAS